jgi:hypothetical protein
MTAGLLRSTGEPATSVAGRALSQSVPFHSTSSNFSPAVARGFFSVAFTGNRSEAIRRLVADLDHAQWLRRSREHMPYGRLPGRIELFRERERLGHYCASLALDDMPGLAAARPTSTGIRDRPTSFDLMALGNSAAWRARGAGWPLSTIARTWPAASSARREPPRLFHSRHTTVRAEGC